MDIRGEFLPDNPGFMGEEPDINICICSYRRPEIRETLRSIAMQTGIARDRVRVIVADNTPDAECRDVVAVAAIEFGLDLHFIHAPANNISIARNACLDRAQGRWIAFVDDDEIPARHWLAALMTEAETGGWDAVLGPVTAIYREGAPQWMRRGDFHSTRPVRVAGRIRTAYTGNVLFRRELVDRLRLRFRNHLGLSGGEDEDFFYRFSDAGGRIGFAATAQVYEHVETKRASMGWLLRRNFRAGQSHGARLMTQNRPLANVLLASAKAIACGLGALAHPADAVARNRYLARASLHCGVVAKLAGLGEIEMYPALVVQPRREMNSP